MEGELFVLSGPQVGQRFRLGAEEVRIGNASGSAIRLEEAGVAVQHCAVSCSDGRHCLVDRSNGAGTFVNGKRISAHWLQAGDQVTIGATVLLYQTESPEPSVEAPEALLRACSLLFLFKAMATAEAPALRSTLEAQLLSLIGDLTPCRGGAVLLGRDAAELEASADAPALKNLARRVCREGAVAEAETNYVAVPLYVRGAIAGMIAAQYSPQEAGNLEFHCDTLAAISTLGAVALETVREVQTLNTEKTLLLERLGVSPGGAVGDSPAFRKLMQMVARVAQADTSVLILGESGTGKEVIANALHRQSLRSGHPFVAINCAAITETLLESELFGHERGAFTGAVMQKRGKLEMAEGGTAFLDEIGELAHPLQAKLLRVLQQREFERVGGTRTVRLDVRIIAATNRDLAAEVRRGTFREDLYHRLNVIALEVPPLRERPGDIPALAQHFLERSSARCRRRVRGISPQALDHLRAYPWPGNVRELENAIERAVVLGQSDLLLAEDLPDAILDAPGPVQSPGALQTSVTDVKRQAILKAWQEAGGDYKKAASALHIHPNSLLRLVRLLGLREALG